MYDLAALNAEEPVERALSLREELDAMRPLDPEQAGKAMQRLRLEWTYHSNAIEGNSLTYGETRALLLHGVTAQGKPLKDHLDIKGHREALGYLERFVKAEEPLTLTAIRELHEILLGEPYESWAETPDGKPTRRTITPGEFKTQPNHVITATGKTHYYARPEETPALMQDLVDWFQKTWPEVEVEPASAIPFATDLHHRFAAIHPFDDGNGRMARLLMNLVLMRAGYPPAVLRQENRPAYYGALAQADAGDLGPLVRFVADELRTTLDLYLRTLRGEPDPDAFSRRVALLTRQINSSSESENRTPEAIAQIARDFILPLLERVGSGLKQLSPLFNETSGYGSYSEGNHTDHVTHGALYDVLRKGEWHRFGWHVKLGGYRRAPRENIHMAIHGTVGDDFIVLTGGWTPPDPGLACIRYDDPSAEKEALALAGEVLERVLDRVEELHATSQDQ